MIESIVAVFDCREGAIAQVAAAAAEGVLACCTVNQYLRHPEDHL